MTTEQQPGIPNPFAPWEPAAPSAATGDFNIASYLPRMAERFGDRPAFIATAARQSRRRPDAAANVEERSAERTRGLMPAGRPGGTNRELSFAGLEALSNRYANGFAAAGIGRGMRVLVMVRQGLDFPAVIFALFKMGAVPVLIDPGMGVRRMLECIRSVDLHGLIGIPAAHAVRVLGRRPFKLVGPTFPAVAHVVTVGRRWFWGGPTLRNLAHRASDRFSIAETQSTDTAAILFTSGSTGPAKGVAYEHGMFDAQVRAISSYYGIQPGEIDLPGFPLFALFSVAMGMTSVIPDMDPSNPARVDPEKIVTAIREHHVTNTFGSPAMWRRVAEYCVARSIRLPSLRRVLIAGAAVPLRTIEQLHAVLSPEADVHTPYGATESLPVASIAGRELLGKCAQRTRQGGGVCVGRALPGVNLRIIRITDDPIPVWSERWLVSNGQTGEIVVSGPVVTKEYFGLPAATAAAKIRDGHRVWHRIGDVGYFDEQDRIWFCGRKAHRVETASRTLFSVMCEAVFDEHPHVYRSALVGVGPAGRQRPVIVVEPHPDRFPRGRRRKEFINELLTLGVANELSRPIHDVLFHRSLPVDVRHNFKINREALAAWAEKRI